ncbi:MAG: helix-turn-helix domain-containing protein [Chloroflexia bacterium]|nr:helix-turn-helix domain-containing protein [Chloroflexia bacterium]
MSEIVIGDVLAWEPRLEWRGDESELLRPLSWAVTIHPRIPALPPLRGGELIIVAQRTLDHLKRVEMVSWPEIMRLLSAQPVAGLVVDGEFNNTSIPGVPIISADTGFLVDAESYLNRTITEHRGELYRLGSDLSRALSTASISGADLDALFAVAGDVGRSELVLFDRAGTILGRSRSAPGELPFSPARIDGGNELPLHIETKTSRWLVVRLHPSGNEPLYLATASGSSGSPETARLVLSQTARMIEAFLGSLSDAPAVLDAPKRESLLADLLLGKIADGRIDAQAGILGIDPSESLRVALFVSRETGLVGRVRRKLSRGVQSHITILPTGELAVLMRGDDLWEELQAVARTDGALGLTRSEQQPGLRHIERATRQARTLGRLWLAGVMSDPVVEADNLGNADVVGILLPVWDPPAFNQGPERMLALAANRLGALEDHDRERGSDLIRTLEGYLSAGGSTTGAAELLGVHRNTLGYRLNRISELTGSDLDDAATRLALGLALKIRQIERALS